MMTFFPPGFLLFPTPPPGLSVSGGVCTLFQWSYPVWLWCSQPAAPEIVNQPALSGLRLREICQEPLWPAVPTVLLYMPSLEKKREEFSEFQATDKYYA